MNANNVGNMHIVSRMRHDFFTFMLTRECWECSGETDSG